MTPAELEALLWELAAESDAASGGDRSPSKVPEGSIEAYRDGRLGDAAARQVEEWLGGNDGPRRRLAEQVVSLESHPPERLRERVLAAFEREQGGTIAVPPRRRSSWGQTLASRAGWLVAAASLLFAVWVAPRSSSPPLDLRYEVAGYGLAARRAIGPATETIRAFADTIVRIEAYPEGVASSDVEVGLYRPSKGGLVRMLPGRALRLDWDRGTALFEARAVDLVGSAPGTHEVHVVVGPKGELPATLDTPGEGADRVRRYRVYPCRIELLPQAPAEEGVR